MQAFSFLQLIMVQKRPFDNEEMLEVSFKHPKQVEPSNQLVSFSESVFPEGACHIHKTSGRDLRNPSSRNKGLTINCAI